MPRRTVRPPQRRSERQQAQRPESPQPGPSRPNQARRSLSAPEAAAARDSSDSDASLMPPPPPPPVPAQPRRRSRSLHRRPRANMLQEIQRLQNFTRNLIPRLPFARLIREVLQEYADHDLRITMDALNALQEATELYLTQLFEDAYRCTMHRDRVTLMVKDIQLAMILRHDI